MEFGKVSMKISDSPAYKGLRAFEFMDSVGEHKGEKLGIENLKSGLRFLFKASKEAVEFFEAKGFKKITEGIDLISVGNEFKNEIKDQLPVMLAEIIDLDNEEIKEVGNDLATYIQHFGGLESEEQKAILIDLLMWLDLGYSLFKRFNFGGKK